MCAHNRLQRVTRNNGIQSTGIKGYDLILYNYLDCDTTLAPIVRINGEEKPMPDNWADLLEKEWKRGERNVL